MEVARHATWFHDGPVLAADAHRETVKRILNKAKTPDTERPFNDELDGDCQSRSQIQL